MKYIPLTFISFCAFSALQCYATGRLYTISGFLTTNNSSTSAYLAPGNLFSLSLYYNDAAPVFSSFGSVQKTYQLDSVSLTINKAGSLFTTNSTDPFNKVIVSRGFSFQPPYDGYQFYTSFGPALGFSQIQITTNIAGNFGSNYFTTALSLPLNSLQSVDSAKLGFQIAGTLPSSIVQTFGTITGESDSIAVVPEPANYALCLSAVGSSLAVLFKRRRTSR